MTITPALSNPISLQTTQKTPEAKAAGAAKQFESLLIAQMMKSMHGSGSGWLGTGEDQAGQAAMDFAEEQFASAITNGGGLGLAKVIQEGLNRESAQGGQKLQE